MCRNVILKLSAAVVAFLVSGFARAAWELNMPRGVTPMSHEIYELHMLIFWVCVAIGVVVFGVMLYSVIVHRQSRGAKASQFHESAAVEIGWTVVPFVILIAMAVPSAATLLKIEDSGGMDMTIKVTGYQWLWRYDYLDSGVTVYSRLAAESNIARQLDSGIDPESVEHYLLSVDNRVVVPVDTTVRLLLTSKDVIHSWWVPEFGGKKDAIPGYINDMWFKALKTGVYRGQCAELCGRGHGFMPIVVEVVEKPEFKAWIAKQGGQAGAATQVATAGTAMPAPEPAASAPEPAEPATAAAAPSEAPTQVAQADTQSDDTQSDTGGDAAGGGGGMSKAELMALGEQVYGQCVACHQASGAGMPAAGFPALTGSPIATGPVEDHIHRVLHGKDIMPAFADVLSNKEIAAVVTYERNALGNSTGDLVQPSQVEALR